MSTHAEGAEDQPTRAMSGQKRSLVGILVYYAVAVSGAIALTRIFPDIESLFTMERLQELALVNFSGAPEGGVSGQPFDRFGIGVVTGSLLGALGIMVPVVWSYIVIKRREDYDQSVVHALLMLPVAVTGIVIIVQHSIPLAFSLAGIAAAVRFRTTLKDTKDAVYVFMSIGVGLSAGVQALGVAFVVSFVFNLITLVLWRIDFGNIYTDQLGRNRPLELGDVLAGPSSKVTAVSFGDQRLARAMNPKDLREVAERVARMERYIADEAVEDRERKLFHVLIVHAQNADLAQRTIESRIADMSARWRLTEITPAGDGLSTLQYLVRLRTGQTPGSLMEVVRAAGGSNISAAEMRSLSGLKKGS
ncbi:MAG: DUF4956 domain-containing protein [Gemmatimonadetes bacterium]|nr:DUF4956 domain-containing protein [Gemmatimonadota bacterium]